MNGLDLETLTLEAGGHEDHDHFCVMEAVAFLAGEPWTDAPKCAGPALGAFCRALNDAPEPAGAANRERLRGYIPAPLGPPPGTPPGPPLGTPLGTPPGPPPGTPRGTPFGPHWRQPWRCCARARGSCWTE